MLSVVLRLWVALDCLCANSFQVQFTRNINLSSSYCVLRYKQRCWLSACLPVPVQFGVYHPYFWPEPTLSIARFFSKSSAAGCLSARQPSVLVTPAFAERSQRKAVASQHEPQRHSPEHPAHAEADARTASNRPSGNFVSLSLEATRWRWAEASSRAAVTRKPRSTRIRAASGRLESTLGATTRDLQGAKLPRSGMQV